ncbi:MAG: hypothetical protein HY718_06650 [Planctomycetes bacterium]|nr:hypothetical protein [Planctomycetota bacterium]
MKRLILTVVFLPVVMIPGEVLAADTWCWANHPGAIFCDDFDRYCVSPPADPTQACAPVGDERDHGAMGQVWRGMHQCGYVASVNDQAYESYPYAARNGGDLNYANAGMPGIKRVFGEAFSAVRGTDLTPLVLEFGLNGSFKLPHGNTYLEMGYGRAGTLLPTDGPAPYEGSLTNWVSSEDCTPCGLCSDAVCRTNYPIICRQTPTPAGCPTLAGAKVIPAIAAGAVAFLDPNPCHCNEGNIHWSTNYRLNFFDGLQWWILRRGMFPDPGGPEPAPGDFLLSTSQYNYIRLTVKSTTVIVELRAAGTLSRCEVPLAYIGPFSSLSMGYQIPCKLKVGSWECCTSKTGDCLGDRPGADCLRLAPGGGVNTLDNIVVYGGQGEAAQGACCYPNTSCDVRLQGDCTTLGGVPGEPGSTCANTACCPPLLIDHDMDQDIDVEDFGWFQTCLSGAYVAPPTVPCYCADLDHDGDVDTPDVEIFVECMLGPEVPANPNCLN